MSLSDECLNEIGVRIVERHVYVVRIRIRPDIDDRVWETSDRVHKDETSVCARLCPECRTGQAFNHLVGFLLVHIVLSVPVQLIKS